jgi:hypothetical protein
MKENTTDINPFLSTLAIEIVEKYTVRPATVQRYIVEKNPPIGVYMSTELLRLLSSLNSSSKDMAFYIMKYLGYSADTIEIKPDIYCERMSVSLKTFYRAKADLTNVLIIPKKRKDTYYINPSLLFRGTRAKAFPEHVVLEEENPTLRELRTLKIVAPLQERVRNELTSL